MFFFFCFCFFKFNSHRKTSESTGFHFGYRNTGLSDLQGVLTISNKNLKLPDGISSETICSTRVVPWKKKSIHSEVDPFDWSDWKLKIGM